MVSVSKRIAFEHAISYWPVPKQLALPLPALSDAPLPHGAVPMSPSEVAATLGISFLSGRAADYVVYHPYDSSDLDGVGS